MTRSRSKLVAAIPSVEDKVPASDTKKVVKRTITRKAIEKNTVVVAEKKRVKITATLALIQSTFKSLGEIEVPVAVCGKVYGVMSATFFNQCSTVPYGKYVTSINIEFCSKTLHSSIFSFILGRVSVVDESEVENVRNDLAEIMDELGLIHNLRWC